MRRLLPAALVAPLVLGWLALQVQKEQFIDAVFAISLLVVALVVLLVGLAVRQARTVHAHHMEREELLAREQATRILDSITDGFFAVDCEWRFTYVNREAERLLRRPRGELLGRNLWAEFPQAVGATFQPAMGQRSRCGFPRVSGACTLPIRAATCLPHRTPGCGGARAAWIAGGGVEDSIGGEPSAVRSTSFLQWEGPCSSSTAHQLNRRSRRPWRRHAHARRRCRSW